MGQSVTRRLCTVDSKWFAKRSLSIPKLSQGNTQIRKDPIPPLTKYKPHTTTTTTTDRKKPITHSKHTQPREIRPALTSAPPKQSSGMHPPTKSSNTKESRAFRRTIGLTNPKLKSNSDSRDPLERRQNFATAPAKIVCNGNANYARRKRRNVHRSHLAKWPLHNDDCRSWITRPLQRLNRSSCGWGFCRVMVGRWDVRSRCLCIVIRCVDWCFDIGLCWVDLFDPILFLYERYVPETTLW